MQPTSVLSVFPKAYLLTGLEFAVNVIVNEAKKILHVEDDYSIRISIESILEDEGYTVQPVSNGREALTYLSTQKNEIDLILLDVMMPVMDGFTFCTEKSKDDAIALIPTIIYSADDSNRLKAEAIGLPFISKPFNLDNLLDTIAQYVRK